MPENTPVTPSVPANAISVAIGHMTTHWQTSLVGVALLSLAVAVQLGVPLPAVGGVHLDALQLATAGLTALGFLVSRDSNK